MAYASQPYAESVYADGVVPNATPPGQQLPPPIPGATVKYTWGVQPGVRPWSFGGWSGGAAPSTLPAGGIVIAPLPNAGVMQLYAWWPNAGGLQIVRVHADGSRHPVRGAYPITITTPTRVNLCQNPSARAGLNGYVPGQGNPTLSTITRTDTADTAWRATIAASGTCEVTIPQALLGGLSTDTVGLDLQLSARPTGLTITAAWTDALGNTLASSVATLTANQINTSVGMFARQVVHLAPPIGAAVCTTLKVAATGLPGGATLDGARITVEQGYTDGSVADGDILGGQWTGVAELSTSLIAPVQTLLDGECPLDVPVTYEVWQPAVAGGRAASASAVLTSNDVAWLTHPGSYTTPVACRPTVTPTETRKLDQGIFPILGRTRPIVISAANRLAPAGTLSFDAEHFTDRDALLALVADGSPLLLRAPVDFGFGYGQWISLGDLTVDPQGRPAWSQGRLLSAPYQEVDPPIGANSLLT